MREVAETLSFVADKNLTPQKNLDALIKYARVDLAKIYPDKNWDDDSWKIGNRRSGAIITVSWTNIDSGRHKKGAPLQQPFRNFAKAYFVIKQSEVPTKRPQMRLAALRYLERGQIEVQNKADVISINATVFDKAVSIAKKRHKDPYPFAAGLAQIKDFLNEYHLTGARISWQHGVKAQKPNIAIGEERVRHEREKLPPPELFHCMPLLIDKVREPDAASFDVIPVYYFMLLSCSPARAGEICYNLPVDCLYEADNGMSYVRWFPEKGGNPVLKEVYPQMADWVHDIISMLKKHTDEGRKIAKWYEKNPTSIYLPDHLEHLRGKEFVSFKEVQQISGKTKYHQRAYLLNSIGIKPVPGYRKPEFYQFAELEKTLLKHDPLPKGFPYLNEDMQLRFSEALLVTQKYATSYQFGDIPYMFEGVNYEQIRFDFCSNYKTSNIFSRHGFKAADGGILKVNSHSPRHLIDAIRHWKGVGDKQRAKQAGRKDVRQNAYYEHLTGNDMVAMASENGVLGPITELFKRAGNAPVTYEKVRMMMNPYLHLTEWGFCARDFAQSPCEKWGDHLLCSEHWYIKGAMPEKERRLRRTLEETERLLDLAIEIDGNGLPVYDRWAENHSLKAERLKNLISILEDPNVQDGSLIHLSGEKEFSIFSRALDHRLLLNHKGDQELLEIAKQISELNNAEHKKDKGEYMPELLRPYLELIDESELD